MNKQKLIKTKIIKKITYFRVRMKEKIEEVKKLENLYNGWNSINARKHFRKLIIKTNKQKFLYEQKIINLQLELENIRKNKK